VVFVPEPGWQRSARRVPVRGFSTQPSPRPRTSRQDIAGKESGGRHGRHGPVGDIQARPMRGRLDVTTSDARPCRPGSIRSDFDPLARSTVWHPLVVSLPATHAWRPLQLAGLIGPCGVTGPLVRALPRAQRFRKPSASCCSPHRPSPASAGPWGGPPPVNLVQRLDVGWRLLVGDAHAYPSSTPGEAALA
jgi:hypothetical protein